MHRVSRLLWAFGVAGGIAGCGGTDFPTVDCRQPVWALPRRGGADVRIVGSWDGWEKPGVAATPTDDGWALALLDLPPGEYGYQIVEDGVARLDRFQPLSTYRGEREVSLLVAPDCAAPALTVDGAAADDAGALALEATYLAAHDGAPLAPAAVTVRVDGAEPAGLTVQATPDTGALTVAATGLAAGKHHVEVEAGGARAEAAVWVKPRHDAWDDAVLYQIVVDRFRGDGGAPLPAPPTPGTRAGGTLAGVTAEIEKGTFEALGVTALWLSPVYENPSDMRVGRDGHLSEGYHGYWPVASRAVDPKIGGEAALDTLIAAAHAHGLRVLFDLVPNHVYETNPVFTAHEHDGWFSNELPHCVCGEPGCDWGAHIIDCWFTPFLPDVRWQSDAALHAAVDDTLFWMRRFDADGVRIDAVPMMPRLATRRIVRAMREAVAPRGALFALGEVFTGPGQIDNIAYFMGKDGLDSAFDFPLMWAMRDGFAGQGALSGVEATLAAGERRLRGSGAVMARMLDNHDTSRFLSDAAGNGGNDAWAAPPPQPTSPEPYARQRLGLALIFSLPGMPLLYYGDEVALAGAGDPDCRRPMPAEGALSEEQQATLALTKRLAAARRCLPALRRGERIPVWADATTLAFARDAGDGAPALALFSTAASPSTVHVPGGVLPPGEYVDVISGAHETITGAAALSLEPLRARLLLPAHHPACPDVP